MFDPADSRPIDWGDIVEKELAERRAASAAPPPPLRFRLDEGETKLEDAVLKLPIIDEDEVESVINFGIQAKTAMAFGIRCINYRVVAKTPYEEGMSLHPFMLTRPPYRGEDPTIRSDYLFDTVAVRAMLHEIASVNKMKDRLGRTYTTSHVAGLLCGLNHLVV